MPIARAPAPGITRSSGTHGASGTLHCGPVHPAGLKAKSGNASMTLTSCPPIPNSTVYPPGGVPAACVWLDAVTLYSSELAGAVVVVTAAVGTVIVIVPGAVLVNWHAVPVSCVVPGYVTSTPPPTAIVAACPAQHVGLAPPIDSAYTIQRAPPFVVSALDGWCHWVCQICVVPPACVPGVRLVRSATCICTW